MTAKKKSGASRAPTQVAVLVEMRDQLREMGGGMREMGGGMREMKDGMREMNDGMREMKDGMREMGASMREMKDEIHTLRVGTEARFESLESAFNHGFEQLGTRVDGVSRRLDGIRDIAGDRYRDHEDRIRHLERRTGIKPGDPEKA